MIEQIIFGVTVLAALGSGLLAGNFFAFSAFLMTALGRLSAERGIVAMQAITAAIVSPLFLVVFFGTAALCAVLSGAAILQWSKPGALYLLAGSLFFLMGTFPVTMMGNVPLNNELARIVPNSPEGASLWKRFQSSWGAWNLARTLTSLAACASFIMALVEAGSPFIARV
jgi:uncharacterized membrane protein